MEIKTPKRNSSEGNFRRLPLPGAEVGDTYPMKVYCGGACLPRPKIRISQIAASVESRGMNLMHSLFFRKAVSSAGVRVRKGNHHTAAFMHKQKNQETGGGGGPHIYMLNARVPNVCVWGCKHPAHSTPLT